MTFAEKISIILNTNKLGIATKEDLAAFAGFSRDTIRKAVDRSGELNPGNTRIFLDKLGINRGWWETGKGPVFNEKHTSVQDEPAVTGKPDMERWEADAFKKIIQGGAEYVLVPRHAFDGNHRFTSVEQIEIQAKELEHKSREVERRAKEAAEKDEEIRNLTRTFIELIQKVHGLGELSHLPKVEEAKKDATV